MRCSATPLEGLAERTRLEGRASGAKESEHDGKEGHRDRVDGRSPVGRQQRRGAGGYLRGGARCDFVVEDFAAPWDSAPLSAALAQASAEPLTICLAGTTTEGLRLLETLRTDVTICSLDGREFVTQGVLVQFDGEPGALRVVGPHFVTGGFAFDLSLGVFGVVERVELSDVSVLVDPSDAADYHTVVYFDVETDALGAPELVFDGVTVGGPTYMLFSRSAVSVEFDASRGPALTITNPGDEQRPLFRADSAVDLTLKGSLTRTLQSDQKASPLTGDDFMEATVTLDGLTVEGYDCDPCVQAGRIDVRDTTWTLGVDETDTPAEAGTWLYAGPDHTITLDQVTFQTAGVPWILANADRVQALGLDMCAVGGPGSAATPLFSASDAVTLWNSALAMAAAETPLVTGEDWVGLRGVTVVTGNTGGNLAERSDTLEASNTLFVGATASADAALPDRSGGWPAHVVRAEAAADIFSSPADVFNCLAKPKPDAGIAQVQDLGVKAESNADGTLTTLWERAANELGELPGRSFEGEPLDWCDPDGEAGSWPDIGTFSGPFSASTYDPGVEPGRSCTDVDGSGADTGVPGADTGATAPERTRLARGPAGSVDRRGWRSACRCSAVLAAAPAGVGPRP